MADFPPKLLRTFLALTLTLLVIFGGLGAGLTWQLRARLHAEVLRREAQAMHEVAILEINSERPRAAGADALSDLFPAVLESSRLRGVLAVQLFDRTGTLRQALPAWQGPASQAGGWWPSALTEPIARFVPNGALENVYGLAVEAGNEPTLAPLLEVVVPLTDRRQTGVSSAVAGPTAAADPNLGVARYWIDGSGVAAEYQRLDHGLAGQAGVAFLGGSGLIAIALAWTFLRLKRVNDRLVAQGQDLANANEELDFAAKTGAIGAISAHLIHGLKNPLAGLESFVSEGAEGNAGGGEAWHSAMDTTRRLRGMINEIVAVLGDEKAGSADYPVPVAEILEMVVKRTASACGAKSVELVVLAATPGAVTGRTANLAGLILANLAANSIEASPPGGRVDLEARQTEGTLQFLVRDGGPGLPLEVRDKLFRPVRSRKPGGGGIGLAISHRLAKHAGGNLELVKSDGRGTTFRLVVPAAETCKVQ